VTGEGRAFCAGMDLSVGGNVFGLDESRQPSLADMTDLNDPRLERGRDTGGRVTLAVHDCRKPVIAAINGPTVGIGATMTLAMDRRIMSEKARFGLVFGRIGIVPEAASTWFLERLVGPAFAMDLLLRADILTADSAVSIRLAEDVVPESNRLTVARETADAWTKDRSPVAVAFARQMVRCNGALAHPVDTTRLFTRFSKILTALNWERRERNEASWASNPIPVTFLSTRIEQCHRPTGTL